MGGLAYCDGSLLDDNWRAISCIGFGIVVTSGHGDLLAYGLGWPPSWCDTAAAAEAWAAHWPNGSTLRASRSCSTGACTRPRRVPQTWA